MEPSQGLAQNSMGNGMPWQDMLSSVQPWRWGLEPPTYLSIWVAGAGIPLVALEEGASMRNRDVQWGDVKIVLLSSLPSFCFNPPHFLSPQAGGLGAPGEVRGTWAGHGCVEGKKKTFLSCLRGRGRVGHTWDGPDPRRVPRNWLQLASDEQY